MMIGPLANISSQSEGLNILLLIGIAVFFGTVGARVLQRLRIPQIVGYVTIGIILGSLLKIISPTTVQQFELFNLFALGGIGFLVGGELEGKIFTRYGKAMEHMRHYHIEYMTVIGGDQGDMLVGVLEHRQVNRRISAEVLARQQKADNIHSA